MLKKIGLLSLISLTTLGTTFAQSGEQEMIDPRLLQQQREAEQQATSQIATTTSPIQTVITGENTTGTNTDLNIDPRVLQQQLDSQNQTYDYYSDNSLQRFINDHHPFTNLKYTPEKLKELHSPYLYPTKQVFKLRKEAAEQLLNLAENFWNAQGQKKKLTLTSTYRSYQEQAKLAKNCSPQHCAKAGTSEHQAGLAADLRVNGRRIDPDSYAWLREHAHLRGFHQTYQKGIKIDGKIIEPWHWRYLGVQLATELYEKKMSFTQWFKEQEVQKNLAQ